MKKNLCLLLSALLLIAFLITSEPFAEATVPAAQDSWMSKAPMPHARAAFGMVEVGGKIYAIGGSLSIGTGISGLSYNEEYDPRTDTWAAKADMPTARAYFATAAYKDLIYCIGGVIGTKSYAEPAFNGLVGQVDVFTNAFEVYNTTSNTWESTKAAPVGIAHCKTHVIGDSIIIVQVGKTAIYNITEGTWALKSKVPISYAPNGLVSTCYNNKILVTEQSSPDAVYSYDPTTDNWANCSSCPFYAVLGIAATAGAKAPGLVYIFGWAYPTGNAELFTKTFNPEKGVWSEEAAPMPNPRQDFGIAIIDDVVYTVGGITWIQFKETPSNLNEQYTPIGYSTPPQISFATKQNQTYNQSTISFNTTFDKAVNWSGYSLDSQQNVTYLDTINLTNLQNGVHNITVYANDTYGTMSTSQTLYFTVDTPNNYPWVEIIIPVSIIVTALVTIALYSQNKKK